MQETKKIKKKYKKQALQKTKNNNNKKLYSSKAETLHSNGKKGKSTFLEILNYKTKAQQIPTLYEILMEFC